MLHRRAAPAPWLAGCAAPALWLAGCAAPAPWLAGAAAGLVHANLTAVCARLVRVVEAPVEGGGEVTRVGGSGEVESVQQADEHEVEDVSRHLLAHTAARPCAQQQQSS